MYLISCELEQDLICLVYRIISEWFMIWEGASKAYHRVLSVILYTNGDHATFCFYYNAQTVKQFFTLCFTVYCGECCFADSLFLFKQPQSVIYHCNQYDEEI